jgi:uncharacterized protein (TIGR02996 family)
VSHTSGDGAALLRAICDNPDEDTPRLVYADWLDERGGESNEARAELIRLQIVESAKARQKHLTAVGVLRQSTERESELIQRYGGTESGGWTAGLPKLDGVRYQSTGEREWERFDCWLANRQEAAVRYTSATAAPPFDRGFPWRVYAADADLFLRVAPVLFDAAPIAYLHLDKLTVEMARRLAASPHLARIRQWQDVDSRRTDRMMEILAGSEHLGNLREMDFSRSPLSAKGLRALLFAPALRAVTRLTFLGCDLGDAGAEAIAESPACARLEHLNLMHRPRSVAGVRALAGAPLRQSMRSLVLSHANLHDDSALVLAGAEWPRLQFLDLDDNLITDRGAAAFLDSHFWRRSECEIWLGNNPAGYLSGANPLSAVMKYKLKTAFGSRVKVIEQRP